jgi:hypothetical protein
VKAEEVVPGRLHAWRVALDDVRPVWVDAVEPDGRHVVARQGANGAPMRIPVRDLEGLWATVWAERRRREVIEEGYRAARAARAEVVLQRVLAELARRGLDGLLSEEQVAELMGGAERVWVPVDVPTLVRLVIPEEMECMRP